MARLTTTVQVPFSEEIGFGGGRLLWETQAGFSLGNNDDVRLYPATGLQGLRVRANIGNVLRGAFGSFSCTEAVQFSGGTTATTKYPITGGFGFQSFGMLFDSDGNLVGGGVGLDVPTPGSGGSGTTRLQLRGTRNGVESNIAIYGHMEVNYTTNYYVYHYEPLIEIITGARGVIGTRVTKGFIGAFENGNVALYEVPLTTFEVEDDKEVYRVISKAVVNSEDTYEFPPDWTGQAGSPTFSDGKPDPALPSITHERIHEQGLLTAGGSFYHRRFNVRKETPFFGSGSYRPEFEIRIATPGSGGVTVEDLAQPSVQSGITDAQQRFGI